MENLKIVKDVSSNKVKISPIGTINNDTSELLSKELAALDYSDLDLTIDLAKTDYITSAGLRVLLVARKKLNDNSMHVINANDAILEVFEITGFNTFIKIESNQSEIDGTNLTYANLLNIRATKFKDKVAFIYKEKEYTWGDLDVASSIIAKDLSIKGVKKGTHVGICGANSINWIFTFFAIQKLGGVAVLINPKLNPNEVEQIVEIGDVTHFCYAEIPGLTTFSMYSNECLKSNIVKNTYDISDRIDFLSRKDEFKEIKNLYRENYHVDDASIVIFTSGSTGKPKAVLSSAFSISSSVKAIIDNFKVTSDEVNLAFLPFFHIFGLETNIVIPLLKGFTSIIPDDKKPSLMIELIDKYKCTIFNTVPTMILGIISDPTFTPLKLASLRASVLGGSTTTSEQMSFLMKLLPNNHFGNIYGMSENASIAITDYNDTVEHITKTVGKPVEGMEVSIRDTKGNVLKNNESGEIYIRSKSMLVCYYKLDLSKQPLDDEGWLATGDLGFIDNDGYIRLTGRAKDLIISGGENISPGEVAEVISKLPNVRETKVIGIPDKIKGEVVCAVIHLKEGCNFDEELARNESSSLAKYKQPKYYVVVDSFPLLGSGKIDTIKLKEIVLEKLNLK